MLADWKRARVLNVEMESGCLFTLASLYGIRAGTICTVSDRCPWASPGQDAAVPGPQYDRLHRGRRPGGGRAGREGVGEGDRMDAYLHLLRHVRQHGTRKSTGPAPAR
jgi:hypothetical protein